MKQYTERELDKKIHAFITSKTDLFPEIAGVKQGTTNQALASDAKASVLQDLFSVKLKPIFK